MSKLKVNELDTRSGTTITVAAGKTLAGTDIIGSTQIAANAVDTSEIAANAVTLAEMAGLVRGKIIVGEKEPYKYLIRSIENFMSKPTYNLILQKQRKS